MDPSVAMINPLLNCRRSDATQRAIGLRSGHVSRRNETPAFGIEAELDVVRAPVRSFLERAPETYIWQTPFP